MPAWWRPEYAGYATAFLSGFSATAWDCHSALTRTLLHVPLRAFLSLGFVVLGSVCGILACVVYNVSEGAGQPAINTIFPPLPQAPFFRGIVVGALVLVLIRSRVIDVAETALGGDAVYTFFRDRAKQAYNESLLRKRQSFLNDNMRAAFDKANYFDTAEQRILNSIRTRPRLFKSRVNKMLRAAKAKKPTVTQSADSPDWRVYYETLTGICYDACGARVAQELMRS
jgi:hypothetical protein